MAYGLVGTAAVVSQGAASAAVTPAWGTSQNRTANNILTCTVAGSAVATFPTTPAGWTIGTQVAGTSCSSTIYFKVAAGADAAPTIAAVTSAIWSVQLAEFQTGGGIVTSPLDHVATTSGTTSPQTATATLGDAQAGDLVIGCWSEYRSMTATSTYTATFNNGATATNTANTGTSTQSHYGFSWGVNANNSSTDSFSVSGFSTSQLTGTATALVSFKPPAAGVVSMSATASLLTHGPGPYLVAAGSPTLVGTSPTAPSFAQATIAGDLLVALVVQNGASAITLATNPGNAWVQAVSPADNITAIFYRPNCGAGESPPTFTAAGSPQMGSVLLEFGGMATANVLDQTAATASAQTTSPYTVTVPTTGVASQLVVACVGNAESTPPSSQTLSFNNSTVNTVSNNSGSIPSFIYAYGYDTATATPDSATVSWATGSGPHYSTSLATFLPAGTIIRTGAVSMSAVAQQLVYTGPGLIATGPVATTGAPIISPAFGAPTMAGDLLVALLASGATNTTFGCSDPTWTSSGGTNGTMIWYKADCGTNETPPSFTVTPAIAEGAILLEFAGALAVSPLDQQAGASPASTGTTTVTMPGADAGRGEILVASSVDIAASSSTETSSDSFNNATVINLYNQDSLSSPQHFRFSYALTTANASADANTHTSSVSSTGGITTKLVSFKVIPAGSLNSPFRYAGVASDLANGTGSWTSLTNADGLPDGAWATWTAP